jgi:hypothetical protein
LLVGSCLRPLLFTPLSFKGKCLGCSTAQWKGSFTMQIHFDHARNILRRSSITGNHTFRLELSFAPFIHDAEYLPSLWQP